MYKWSWKQWDERVSYFQLFFLLIYKLYNFLVSVALRIINIGLNKAQITDQNDLNVFQ